MAHTLEQFAADCHRILTADPGPAGRQQVCTLLQEVLKDDDFIATHLGDNVPERKILYEDLQLTVPVKYGKVRKVRTYTLKPGMAYAYHEGQLHSPRREGQTRLIRIEGLNMEKVKRLAFEPV